MQAEQISRHIASRSKTPSEIQSSSETESGNTTAISSCMQWGKKVTNENENPDNDLIAGWKRWSELRHQRFIGRHPGVRPRIGHARAGEATSSENLPRRAQGRGSRSSRRENVGKCGSLTWRRGSSGDEARTDPTGGRRRGRRIAGRRGRGSAELGLRLHVLDAGPNRTSRPSLCGREQNERRLGTIVDRQRQVSPF